MTKTLTLPLVGQHFHPPAKALLEHLPAGVSLRLKHDTENPYDEFATEVHVEGASVPESQHLELSVKVPGNGFSLEEVIAPGAWWKLGHLASSDGKPLIKARLVRADLVGNKELFAAAKEIGENVDQLRATLGFDGSGMTVVEVKIEKVRNGLIGMDEIKQEDAV